MEDVWGLTEPPVPSAEHPPPLPPRLADLAALDRPRKLADPGSWQTPAAEELPEVAALAGDRWRPLHPAPLYSLLPALWPTEHRCWVPDRLPTVVLQQRPDGTLWVLPASPQPTESAQRPEAAEAAAAGLPPPPAGRIWLLRSPWPWLGLPVVLSLIWRRAQQSGPASLPHDLVPAARALFGLTEAELRAWWTGADAAAAAAWEATGRVGEDVAAFVERGLGPAEVQSLVAGAGLTEAQIVAWCDSIGGRGPAVVERIQLWRAYGMPADPPDYLYHFDDFLAAELRAWLDAGFDHAQMLSLQGIPLARAVLWREAGYSAADTAELLDADERLAPAEAAEFAGHGIAGPERLEWIERGFTADQAHGYREAGVRPDEARVWRSLGLGPADVRDGARLPPGYQRAGGTSGPSQDASARDRHYEVADPPGTRGRIARHRSGPDTEPP